MPSDGREGQKARTCIGRPREMTLALPEAIEKIILGAGQDQAALNTQRRSGISGEVDPVFPFTPAR